MKIGIFDSGLGGLLVTKSIIDRLPQYNYLYLGDTKRVPYGNRSQQTIYEFTEEAVAYLFRQDCKLVILACNTASAEALRKIQQSYLPHAYPDRRVLGVIIPTAEQAAEAKPNRVGVLATASTVESGAYIRELGKLLPGAGITQQAAPLLVPLIENDGLEWVDPILDTYLEPLVQAGVEQIILGCTHYGVLKEKIRSKTGLSVVAQEDAVPARLETYLERHPEIERALQPTNQATFQVTDLTSTFQSLANRLMEREIELKSAKL